MHAEQGQVLVVAASHLIFLRRHPSHALMTTKDQLVPAYGRNEMVRMARTLEALMAVVLVHKDIICEMVREPNHTVCARLGGGGGKRALFWVSLGWWYCWGAKLKLDICELCGSSRRTVGSFDMVMDMRSDRLGARSSGGERMDHCQVACGGGGGGSGGVLRQGGWGEVKSGAEEARASDVHNRGRNARQHQTQPTLRSSAPS